METCNEFLARIRASRQVEAEGFKIGKEIEPWHYRSAIIRLTEVGVRLGLTEAEARYTARESVLAGAECSAWRRWLDGNGRRPEVP